MFYFFITVLLFVIILIIYIIIFLLRQISLLNFDFEKKTFSKIGF